MVIDNILSNDLLGTALTLSGILETDISDHYPVFHNIDMSLSPKENLYQKCWSITGENITRFMDALNSQNCTNILSCTDAQKAYTSFHLEWVCIFSVKCTLCWCISFHLLRGWWYQPSSCRGSGHPSATAIWLRPVTTFWLRGHCTPLSGSQMVSQSPPVDAIYDILFYLRILATASSWQAKLSLVTFLV